MLPPLLTHADYQHKVRTRVHDVAERNPDFRRDIYAHAEAFRFFWSLNLDRAQQILRRSYAQNGPLAYDPAVLLRIFFLMFLYRDSSFGAVLERLEQDLLLRVVCGLDAVVPGRSTLYDFLHRLPGFEVQIRRERRRRIHRHPKKPKHKYRKGEKPPPRHPGVVGVLARRKSASTLPAATQLDSFLNMLLDEGFVKVSREKGLVSDSPWIAADSTPFDLHADPYGRRTAQCDCPPATGRDCPHLRVFSAPRAAWAWCSSQGRWYYGYRFYEITQAQGPELPLYVVIAHRPQTHDSVLGYLALATYLASHRVEKVLLDSAHDNPPTYALARESGAVPLIDLNGGLKVLDDGLPKAVTEVGRMRTQIDSFGRPLCEQGAMVYRGESNGYHRYDCPAMRAGEQHPCRIARASCLGVTSHVKVAMDPRHICEIPRGTETWEKEYDRRTTVERSHKRKKGDFGAEARQNRLHPIVAALYALAACMQHAAEWAKAVDGQALVSGWLSGPVASTAAA